MRPIIQEEKSGCGIASVATILKKSYQEVRVTANSLGIFAEDEKLFSDTNYVRTLLNEYGTKISQKELPFTSWDKLPNTALLSIKYHIENGQPFWHWVVFHRNIETGEPVVFDSAAYLEQNERLDFNEMHPKWFIEIYKP